MKHILFLWVLLVPVWVEAQDCSLVQYQTLLKEADIAVQKGQYDFAINKLQSTKTCRPERGTEISKKIFLVFDKINLERQLAIKNAAEAKRQQEIARQNAAEMIRHTEE